MKQSMVIWALCALCALFVYRSVNASTFDTSRNVASIYMSLHGGGK